jgi:hypothetical protein
VNKTSLISLFGSCLLLLPAAPAQAEGDYRPLFDGQSLAGWTVDPAYAANFTVENGLLKVRGSGGWLKSTKAFTDFTLRVEFRYLTEDPSSERVGLAGIYLRSAATAVNASGWPQDTVEVQMGNRTGFRPALPGDGRWSGAVLLHGVSGGPVSFDTAAALRAYGATGEWQVMDIHVLGGTITVTLNGHYIGRAVTGAAASGFIGIQAENGETEFRRIELRETRGAAPDTASAPAPGFVRVLGGGSLDGWVVANPESTAFTPTANGVRVTGRDNRDGESANVCRGNLFSTRHFGDVIVRFDARFEQPLSDSGFLIRVPPVAGDQRGGGSYQVQLQGMGDRELPWNGSLFRQGGVPQGETTFDFAAAGKAYSPVGEWNHYEIEAYKTWITVRVNGVTVSRAENVGVPEGPLGIQCEVGIVEIRNLDVMEIRG